MKGSSSAPDNHAGVPAKGSGYIALIVIAVLAALTGIWRLVVASQHLIAARSIVDDPSMRELEQVSAVFEGGAALILFLHAAAALSMARSGVRVVPRVLFALAAYSGVVIAAGLLGMKLFQLPGLFPLAIALGSFTLCVLWSFSWLSIYLGVVIGGALAWTVVMPGLDLFACLFVIVPCVVYAFAGAWLGQSLARRAGRPNLPTSGRPANDRR